MWGQILRRYGKAETSKTLFPPAFCLLPPASCLLPPASCLLPPASCLLPLKSIIDSLDYTAK
ncbi:MAG: hypothetical protein F6K41_05160 [Symploca sp. SIO3E6]|nr:hypothetical protein [Caldora sp. SIO3E6]